MKNIKNIKIVLLFLFLFYLSLHVIIYIFEKQFVFRNVKLAQNHEFHFNLPHQEFFLEANDGTKINCLLIKTEKKRQGVVFYLHGNAGNIQMRGHFHKHFTSRGYDFFMLDYRSYGKTLGEPSVEIFNQDAALAYDYITQQISPDSLIIYGRSLGTGVATHLASTQPAKRLMLEMPYSTIKTVIANRFIPLFLPFEMHYPFENIYTLPKVTIPIVIFHGTKDKTISYECAQELVPFLKEKDEFITVEGAGHRNLANFEAFQNGLDKYLLEENEN